MIQENQLLKSPLFDTILEYISSINKVNDTLFIFVPYIQTNILSKLLQSVSSKIVIVTTWRSQDLISGSSELNLYPFCKERGIALYVNNRIHLKVYSAGLNDVILTTANLSQRGLLNIAKANFECAIYTKNLTNEDRLYFAQIQNDATHVNDRVYEIFLSWYKEQEKIKPIADDLQPILDSSITNDFLISALPMTSDPETLTKCYLRINQGLTASEDKEIQDCVFHDLANYNIKMGLNEKDFRSELTKSFLRHPFIRKIDEFISPKAYFGGIKEWIQKNCTDVPIPSRRELTGNVQVLLKWFQLLGGGKYVVDVPGSHSQRIRKVM